MGRAGGAERGEVRHPGRGRARQRDGGAVPLQRRSRLRRHHPGLRPQRRRRRLGLRLGQNRGVRPACRDQQLRSRRRARVHIEAARETLTAQQQRGNTEGTKTATGLFRRPDL